MNAAGLLYERLVVYKAIGDPARGTLWTPVARVDVPDWLKDPDVMTRLVRGEIASKPGAVFAPGAEEWWMARTVADLNAEAQMMRLH